VLPTIPARSEAQHGQLTLHRRGQRSMSAVGQFWVSVNSAAHLPHGQAAHQVGSRPAGLRSALAGPHWHRRRSQPPEAHRRVVCGFLTAGANIRPMVRKVRYRRGSGRQSSREGPHDAPDSPSFTAQVAPGPKVQQQEPIAPDASVLPAGEPRAIRAAGKVARLLWWTLGAVGTLAAAFSVPAMRPSMSLELHELDYPDYSPRPTGGGEPFLGASVGDLAFSAKNNWFLALYDIQFQCAISDGSGITAAPDDEVESLAPGASADKRCGNAFVETSDPDGARLTVSADYTPLIRVLRKRQTWDFVLDRRFGVPGHLRWVAVTRDRPLGASGPLSPPPPFPNREAK
jgi:hypothetical protein